MLEFLDYIVLTAYFSLIVAIAWWSQKRDQSSSEYFLAGRNIPWVLAGLSIIATEASALTFLGAPTQSLRGDWTYLQLALGSILGKIVVAFVLIPAYYRSGVDTVYGYLGRRFGPWTKNASSLLFFVGRSLGSGVRLYGAAIALVMVIDINFVWAITLIALVALLYTSLGGIRSVIYTDSLQGMLLIGGGLCALIHLWMQLDVGPFEFYSDLAQAKANDGADKMRFLNTSLDPKESFTIWAGLLGAMVLTMSTHGTDQDMVQRALTCRDARRGRMSMWLSAGLQIPIVFLFLSLGSALWMYFGGDVSVGQVAADLARDAGESNPDKGFDFVFPFYVMREMPAGLKGVIVAAIFAASMSSLDSAISALATTAVSCWWRPMIAPGLEDRAYRKVGLWFSVFFGVVLVIIALLAWQAKTSGSANDGFGVLILGLKVLTWIFPPLLGVFLVGVWTKRGNDLGNLIAISTGITVLLSVEFAQDLFNATPPFSWAWNAPIACLLSFSIAVLFPESKVNEL